MNNIFDSSKLLFSIPIHERQDVINNQIENVFNMNPNSKIIFHVNQSFKTFDKNLSNYQNIYINSKSFNYQHGKGLLWIHINNFLEAIKLGFDFKYFVILSSNEMFIKKGLIQYIEKYKNGAQIVKMTPDIDWHNFKKSLENDIIIKNMLKELKLETIYGGQTEGQFYEKNIFQYITDIYLKYFGNTELQYFETEEILCQTIFKSLDIDYGLPFTLQNYSNKLDFTETFITSIINNNIIIPNLTIKNNLFSPHIDNDCSSIFSIKRVDRTFTPIRYYLSQKGFVFNNEIYQLNTNYYSNNSSIYLYNNNSLLFKKNKTNKTSDYHWFGYEIEPGYYNINFQTKFHKNLNKNYLFNIGLKIHYPFDIVYDIFNDIEVNVWKKFNIPIHIEKKQLIIFIFDNYLDDLEVEFKNIDFIPINNNENNKENIIISLYEDTTRENNYKNYAINYTNINKMIYEPFSKLYNIYTFITINTDNNNNVEKYKLLSKLYKPIHLYVNNNKSINKLFINNINNINVFLENNNTQIKFIIYIGLDSIFKKNIIDLNFYINKFNFISYHIPYYNNQISNSYDFMSIPYKNINYLLQLLINNVNEQHICYGIYSNLKDIIGLQNFNFIYNDNYSNENRTPLIKYLIDLNDTILYKNKGYLFNQKYLYNIFYSNNYSKIMKNYDDEFYFYKMKTTKPVYDQWIGLYIDYPNNNTTNTIDIKITFSIKLLKNIIFNKKNDFGIKTHEPLLFINDWIKLCPINEYKDIEIETTIFRKSQYILFNFDNYLEEIEFFIKNFRIIIDIKK